MYFTHITSDEFCNRLFHLGDISWLMYVQCLLSVNDFTQYLIILLTVYHTLSKML